MNEPETGWLLPKQVVHPALHLLEGGTRELSWEAGMPFRQGLARKAQALSQLLVEAGREKPLSSPTSQPAVADPGVFPSQAPAREPLWAHHLPTAFCLGVLLCLDKLPSPSVQQCSYTPQGFCCVMKTNQCTLRKKKKNLGWGAGVSGEQASHTQISL